MKSPAESDAYVVLTWIHRATGFAESLRSSTVLAYTWPTNISKKAIPNMLMLALALL